MCDQQRLRPACAYAQTDQSICWSLKYSMTVKLLTEPHLRFLSLKGGCTASSESTLVKMPHCWKSHVTAHISYHSRGLFEKDRLAFAFLLCVTIMRKTDTISPQEWSCFLRGSLSVGKEYPAKPNVAWISHQMWENACELEKTVPVFQGICNDLTKTPCWVKMGDNLVR